MTIIEDTHLTLAANNFSIFCHYKHARKILPCSRSFTVYNSLIKFTANWKLLLTKETISTSLENKTKNCVKNIQFSTRKKIAIELKTKNSFVCVNHRTTTTHDYKIKQHSFLNFCKLLAYKQLAIPLPF